MRTWVTILAASIFCLPTLAQADLDVAGNILTAPGPGGGTPDGGGCGTCPAPDGDTGLDFKNGEIYVLATNAIHHLVNCQVVGSTPIPGIGLPFALGYDSARDLWIVTDPGADRVYQVNMAGAVVQSWPSPGAGPVGAAYDSNRDLYLISDFSINHITRLNPNTGLPVASIPCPEGTRIAGTGYDPGADLIMYNGRDQFTTYCISASTGALVFSQLIPDAGPGTNNGQGAGIAPDGNGWINHFEMPTLYCIDKDIATPVAPTTWGAIKNVYSPID